MLTHPQKREYRIKWLGGGNYREKFNEVLLIVDNDTFKKISLHLKHIRML